MKKIISILVAFVMLIGVFSTYVSAEYDIVDFPFTDLKEDAWYMEGIMRCYAWGIVSGMTETTFEPNGTLTRAQFVQMLAMYDGVDLEEYKNSESGFEDVKGNHWFNAPVCWAVEQGFVAGLSETRFGPNEPITREQLARLFYLFAESYAELFELDVTIRADLSGYTDEDKISNWAYEQVQWAVAAGIISGMTETTIAPRATATRAQACRMFMMYDEYLIYGGPRDTGGIFRVIADITMTKGVYSEDYRGYVLESEADGRVFRIEYYEQSENIFINVEAEPYQEEYEGESITLYRESANIYMYGVESQYDFSYTYSYDIGTDYIFSGGTLGADGYNAGYTDTQGYSDEEAAKKIASAKEVLLSMLSELLSEEGYSINDLFASK